MRLRPVVLLLAGSILAAPAVLQAAPPAGSPIPTDPAWAADPIWDDGLAEVTVYDAERVIYGKPRPHRLVMIVVKEDLDDERHVKADPPYAGRPLTSVLKLNLSSTIETENYPYHYLASLFVRRDDVRRLVKASVGSQEWCGNTFKEIETWGGTPRVHFHSYFDGQGDGERAIALGEDGLLDEQALLVLRAAILPEGGSVRIRVADPIVTNQAGEVPVREADLAAGPVETISTPAGRFAARRFDLRRSDGASATYWIETGGARSIVKMEASDGRRMSLVSRERRAYWRH